MDGLDAQDLIEVEGIRLASFVPIGDMGSIIFPAARVLLSWLKSQKNLRTLYVIGN